MKLHKYRSNKKYKISAIDIIDQKDGKSKLNATLVKRCENKTDPLSVEIKAKLSYSHCLRADEAKYHAACMQRFLSGVSLSSTKVNTRNFDTRKDGAFQKLCDWYESSDNIVTYLTLYEVQKRMEEFSENGDDIYTIKHLNRKLFDRYGDTLMKTSCSGRAAIITMKDTVDSVLTESYMDISNDGNDIVEALSFGKKIKETLHYGQQEFYPCPKDVTLENLSRGIPPELSSFLDSMMSRSRSQSSQRKKALWKISIAHAIMQFTQKEGYLSPLLLSLGLFVHQTTRSRVLIDKLYSLGYSVSYTEVMKFERNAAVSNAT